MFNEVVDDFIEIDVFKALTFGFTHIVKFQIFNEFDGITIDNNGPLLQTIFIATATSDHFALTNLTCKGMLWQVLC